MYNRSKSPQVRYSLESLGRNPGKNVKRRLIAG